MFPSAAARRLPAVTLTAMSLILGLVGLAVFPAIAQAATNEPSGISLAVNALGSGSSGAGATSYVEPRIATPTERPTSVRGVTQKTIRSPAAGAALGAYPTNIHDFLYVSGLTVLTEPKIGPGGGDLALEFTMKNVSTAPITSSVRFRLDNAINLPVKTLDEVEVSNLAPGETRTVTATIEDVGQWAFYRGHVTMTPAVDIAGTALWPLTRDSFTMIIPWVLMAMLVLLVALLLAVGRLLRPRRLERRLPGRAPGHGPVAS